MNPTNSEQPIQVEVELTYTTEVDVPADELWDYMTAHKMTDRERAAKQLAAEWAEEIPLDTWLCEGTTYYVRNP